jgi:hypothetical protein
MPQALSFLAKGIVLTKLLLMPVLTKAFLSFVGRHFMAFTFFSAGHELTKS